MKLKDWQIEKGVNNSALGRMANIHPSFFTKFHRGDRRMSYDSACRVSAATDGNVTLVDLLVTAPESHICSTAHGVVIPSVNKVISVIKHK